MRISSFSLHSYPPRFIKAQFDKVYSAQAIQPVLTATIDKDDDFCTLRRQLLLKPTIAEHALNKRQPTTTAASDTETNNNLPIPSNTLKRSKWDQNLIRI